MNLRVKLPLFYTLLIAVLGAAFIAFSARLVEGRMLDEEYEHFESLAQVAALNAAVIVERLDHAALRDFVDSVAAHGEHVRYAAILDGSGVVLAHSRRELEGKMLDDPVSRTAAATDRLLMQTDGIDAMDVAAPFHVSGGQWGTLRIGYTMTELQQKVAQARNHVLLAGLLATLAGAAVAVFIAARITGRLRALHYGAEIIGTGNPYYRFADPKDDEVGQLATAFYAMTGQLRKNYQEIERAKREWETSLDAVSDPLFLHDGNFRVLRCNRAYAEAAGLPFREIAGRPYYEVFPKADGPSKGCRRALERQEEGEEEISVPAVGKIFHARFYPVRDADGAYLYSLHILDDITERKKAEKALHELFLGALESLASAIDAKSPWTRGHSERVAGYAVGIGMQMGLADDALEKLRIAALLHDIGKIGTYDDILNKAGKLTDAEYEAIKQHPARGAEMLAPIRQLHDIIPAVRGHHERYDGAGYPDGLKGENIPLAARILAVADTFDSMTAERPYRATPGKARALEEIQRHAGTQFDPVVVEAFLRMESRSALIRRESVTPMDKSHEQ